MGHLGVDRVLALIRERFFWPGMQADVEQYITQVCTCLRQKKTTPEDKSTSAKYCHQCST